MLPAVTHRADLPRAAVTERFGLPITTRARTVVDCAGALAAAPARLLLDRALQIGAVRVADLERRLITEPHRPGNRQIGLFYRELTGAAAESERILHGLLGQAGLQGWRPNLRVWISGRSYEIDIAFAAAMVAIEVDGWAFHVDPVRFRADRRKQNALTLAGWTVIRFTWADLTERPDYVISTICALLARERSVDPDIDG